MIIKNISGSSQDIDIGTAVVTVANNALVALDPGYRWQVNGIYGSKFRVATAAEVGTLLIPALTSANILVGNGSNVASSVVMSGDAAIDNTGAVTVSDLTITGEATGDILYFNGTNRVKLAIGTAGQVLTVNGGATAPVRA